MLRLFLRGTTGLLIIASAGCDRFLSVTTPGVIEADALDPMLDTSTFSYSVRQNFAVALGAVIAYSAWFTGEALVAETSLDSNEFGRRAVSSRNEALAHELWGGLSTARASGDRLVRVLDAASGERDAHYARAALYAGYSVLLMAELFCEGAIDGGPSLTPLMMLDSATLRFTRAIQAAESAGEGKMAAAALVGRARAHLQAGRRTEAAGDAERVSTGFLLELVYVDDQANLRRLGNRLWYLTAVRGALAVAPAYRNLGDPRVPVRPPTRELLPQDGATAFWTQAKYPTHAAPIRLASRLEADYLLAEALGDSSILALIQARRAANGQSLYEGATDTANLLAELLEQRSRDFFLEGKRLGDLRRHPGAIRHSMTAGAEYRKPGYGQMGDQTCLPLPEKEIATNPHMTWGQR